MTSIIVGSVAKETFYRMNKQTNKSHDSLCFNVCVCFGEFVLVFSERMAGGLDGVKSWVTLWLWIIKLLLLLSVSRHRSSCKRQVWLTILYLHGLLHEVRPSIHFDTYQTFTFWLGHVQSWNVWMNTFCGLMPVEVKQINWSNIPTLQSKHTCFWQLVYVKVEGWFYSTWSLHATSETLSEIVYTKYAIIVYHHLN